MEQIAFDQQEIEQSLQIGDICKFIDSRSLKRLGYGEIFLKFADTEWRVVTLIPSWHFKEKNYFDLINEQGITISSISEEVLIKV